MIPVSAQCRIDSGHGPRMRTLVVWTETLSLGQYFNSDIDKIKVLKTSVDFWESESGFSAKTRSGRAETWTVSVRKTLKFQCQ